MNREIFRVDIVGEVLFSIIFTAVLVFIASVSKSIGSLLLVVIPIVLCSIVIKRKLVIENKMLRFENMWAVEEISINDVAQFVTLPVDRPSSANKSVHVVDKTGEVRFEFPIAFIANKNRRRFEEKVLAINGGIEFTVASIKTER